MLSELGTRYVTVAAEADVRVAFLRRTERVLDSSGKGRLKKVTWYYPPGYSTTLRALFRPIIRARLARLMEETAAVSGVEPFVVTPDPATIEYLRGGIGERLVYWNYDDYASYVGGRRIDNPFEHEMVDAAGTVICSSAYQWERLGERFPACRGKLFHLPHGVDESFVNGSATNVSSIRAVSVVGSLTPRYDWELIADVVKRLPDVKFMFVGRVLDTASVIDYRPGERTDWTPHLREVLSTPNVSHVDQSAHQQALPYYRQCGASWMPYDPRHPFVQASCPLKLMDGLGCGRPVISADVPECRLYPKWIRIYRHAEQAAALISESLENVRGVDRQRRFLAQIAFARDNTWTSRARRFVEILERGAGDRREETNFTRARR